MTRTEFSAGVRAWQRGIEAWAMHVTSSWTVVGDQVLPLGRRPKPRVSLKNHACPVCGARFLAKYANRTFCSGQCRERARRARRRGAA